MKITGQNIPLELAAKYKALITTNAPTPTGKVTAKTSQRTNSPKGRKKSPKSVFRIMAEAAYAQARKLAVIRADASFISAETDRLKKGIFDPTYWMQATRITTDYISSTPTNAPDPAPPPYSFRDPAMLPSIVTYPAGMPATAPMQSTGAVVSGQWQESAWTWRKSVFAIENLSSEPYRLPIVWQSKGRISADAEIRPSKPMFSIVTKAWLSGAIDPISDTMQAPTQPHTSIYYLYAINDTTTNPYADSKVLNNTIILNTKNSVITPDSIEKATVLTAPRAMFGHGYNNNSTVTTSYEDEEKVWQLRTSATYTGFLILPTPNDGMTYEAKTISADGGTVAGRVLTPDGYMAWKWKEGEQITIIERPASAQQMQANALNADGSITTGFVNVGATQLAFIHSEATGTQIIPGIVGMDSTIPLSISADGKKIAGYGQKANDVTAIIWSQNDGYTLIDPTRALGQTRATDISADGSTLSITAIQGLVFKGFRWQTATGLTQMQSPSNIEQSTANEISADGSIIVGTSNDGLAYRATIWTQDGTPQIIDTDPLNEESFAIACSRNGSTVIGYKALDGENVLAVWQTSTGEVPVSQYSLSFYSAFERLSESGRKAVGNMLTSDGFKPFIYTLDLR